MLTATVFLSSPEEVLDLSAAAPEYSGDGLAEPMIYFLLVDADEFLPLSAAAPEYLGVLTVTVFLSSSEEVLDSGLLFVGVSPRVCSGGAIRATGSQSQ